MLDPQLALAVEALQRGQVPAAVRLARHHLVGLPSDGVALHLMGVALKGSGEEDGPVRWLGRSVAIVPTSPVHPAAFAGACIDRADKSTAARLLRRPLALEPMSGLYAASISTTVGEDDFATERMWLDRAFARDDQDPPARGNFGIGLRREDRPDEAGCENWKALALQPAQSESLNNNAIFEIRAGRSRLRRSGPTVPWRLAPAFPMRPGFGRSHGCSPGGLQRLGLMRRPASMCRARRRPARPAIGDCEVRPPPARRPSVLPSRSSGIQSSSAAMPSSLRDGVSERSLRFRLDPCAF